MPYISDSTGASKSLKNWRQDKMNGLLSLSICFYLAQISENKPVPSSPQTVHHSIFKLKAYILLFFLFLQSRKAIKAVLDQIPFTLTSLSCFSHFWLVIFLYQYRKWFQCRIKVSATKSRVIFHNFFLRRILISLKSSQEWNVFYSWACASQCWHKQ